MVTRPASSVNTTRSNADPAASVTGAQVRPAGHAASRSAPGRILSLGAAKRQGVAATLRDILVQQFWQAPRCFLVCGHLARTRPGHFPPSDLRSSGRSLAQRRIALVRWRCHDRWCVHCRPRRRGARVNGQADCLGTQRLATPSSHSGQLRQCPRRSLGKPCQTTFRPGPHPTLCGRLSSPLSEL